MPAPPRLGRWPVTVVSVLLFTACWLSRTSITPKQNELTAERRPGRATLELQGAVGLEPVQLSLVNGTASLRQRSAQANSSSAPPIRRVYVVGCGHSGTSVVKRTLASLPGMHCIPKESQLFIRLAGRVEEQRQQLSVWDAAAASRGFSGWVEKTPKHIKQVADIWRADPNARVVFIVRDGRDVAASMLERRVSVHEGLQRWVNDNTHILPHLGDPRLLTVRYEDFADEANVLGMLRQLSEFVGVLPASDDRLLMALQPPSGMLPAGHQCAEFASEEEKVADLRASYLQLMSGQGAEAKNPAPNPATHNRYRSWQASHAWAPQREPGWLRRLTCGQQAAANADTAVRAMQQQFGYLSTEVRGDSKTACQRAVDVNPLPAGGLASQA